MIKYYKMASARPTIIYSIFSSRIFRSFPIILDLLEHKMEIKNAIEWSARKIVDIKVLKRQIRLSSR